MSTLRVLLESAPESGRIAAWALFDDNGRVLRSGHDDPDAWPAADHKEAVLAAACVRIVALHLPPMPADRVASAAAFALEDQLAGPADEQHIAVAAQRADGMVEAIVASRRLVAQLASDFDRILAEPALAPRPAEKRWRWYASGASGGFVRKPDGAAFATSATDGGVPIELNHALDHAARAGNNPAVVEMAFALAVPPQPTSQASETVFAKVEPWRWDAAERAEYTAAVDLRQGEFADIEPSTARGSMRLFRVAAVVAVVAVGLHVVATLGEWAMLRIQLWRAQSALASLARDAGVIAPDSPAVAIARRHAEARHAAGLAAPADALPLLARAAPVLATLPAATLKSATYADGKWTFDLAKPDSGVADRLERQLAGAGLTALQAANATGVRMRIALAAGAQ